MSNIVQQVLAADAANRALGKASDDNLCSINELEPQIWDYSLPTLTKQYTSNTPFMKRNMAITTSTEFKEKFYTRYPMLVNLDWSNLVLAGGCVGNYITNGSPAGDLDFFIYGLSIEDAQTKLNEVCELFVKHKQLSRYCDKLRAEYKSSGSSAAKSAAKSVDGSAAKKSHVVAAPSILTIHDLPDDINEFFPEDSLNLTFVRTANTLTIDGKFQFIFRIYRNISEVLHGFDLGSSAVGFDGENVYTTQLGKFTYEYGYLIVDTTRRSTTYERRIQKYMDRGFGLILPNLDINKLPNDLCVDYGLPEVCKLPYLLFTYVTRDDNHITLSRFYNRIHSTTSESQSQHDYDIYSGGDDMYGMYYRNIFHIIRGDFDRVIYCSSNHHKVLNRAHGSISAVLIKHFYKNLMQNITSGNFPTRSVANYISVATPEELFAVRDDADKVGDIINRQLEFITAQLEKFDSEIRNIPWITEQPGTQLTSSFNPIFEDPAEWYGEYYAE